MLELDAADARAVLATLHPQRRDGAGLLATLDGYLRQSWVRDTHLLLDGHIEGHGTVLVVAGGADDRALLAVFDPASVGEDTTARLHDRGLAIDGTLPPYQLPFLTDGNSFFQLFGNRQVDCMAHAPEPFLGGDFRSTPVYMYRDTDAWYLKWWDEWAGLPFVFPILCLPDSPFERELTRRCLDAF